MGPFNAENFIVRIYRRERNNPQRIVEVIEQVGVEGRLEGVSSIPPPLMGGGEGEGEKTRVANEDFRMKDGVPIIRDYP